MRSVEAALNRHVCGDIVFFTFEALDAVPGLVHAMSTRSGGVSRAPYDSLNLGFHVGDDARAALENRERFASAVGFPLEDVVSTHQVHGAEVRVVGRAERGRGALRSAGESRASDALVTSERGVFLMGFSADCPLVMLAEPEAGVAGLAHAGWKSAFAGIIRKTVAAMSGLGAEPTRMIAGVSPAIGPCCYEVGSELKDAFPADIDEPGRFFQPRGEKFMFDLPLFCREMLKACGLTDDNVHSARMCSRCHGDVLFSYRGSGGRTGRHAAVVGRRAGCHPTPR